MKGTAVVFGAVLVILGFVVILYAYPTKCDHETSAGELNRAFDDELEREYRSAVFMYWGGIISSVAGAIILVIGFALVSIDRASREGSKDPQDSSGELAQHYPQIVDTPESLAKPITGPEGLTRPLTRSQGTTQSVLQPGSQAICEYCRHMVNTTWVTCPNCGAHLEHLKFFATTREI